MDVCRQLLEKSDTDAENGEGNTPAWLAFEAEEAECAEFLLKEGEADINFACEVRLNPPAPQHRAPSFYSTSSHSVNGLSATVPIPTLSVHSAAFCAPQNGMSYLHQAAGAGRIADVDLLLSLGVSVDSLDRVRLSAGAHQPRSALQLALQSALPFALPPAPLCSCGPRKPTEPTRIGSISPFVCGCLLPVKVHPSPSQREGGAVGGWAEAHRRWGECQARRGEAHDPSALHGGTLSESQPNKSECQSSCHLMFQP